MALAEEEKFPEAQRTPGRSEGLTSPRPLRDMVAAEAQAERASTVRSSGASTSDPYGGDDEPGLTAKEEGRNPANSGMTMPLLNLTGARNDNGSTKSARRRKTEYTGQTIKDLMSEVKDRHLESAKACEVLGKDELIDLLLNDDERQKKWVRSRWFEIIMGIVVICNAAVIGIQIDYPRFLAVSGWSVIIGIFFMIFLSEILIKVHVLGWKEYLADRWNVFDLLVTVLAFVQMSAYYALFSERFYEKWRQYIAADTIQMLRLFRLVRLARVFPELGMLLRSFATSVQALGWIVALMLIWFYLVACFCTVFIGRREWLPSEDRESIRDIREKFANIPMSMFALFEIMTLEGWVDYVRPLIYTRIHIVLFFIGFIFVTSFFMLNLVTAVVVDRTVAAQEEVAENKEKEENFLRASHIQCITGVLLAKNEGEDQINWDKFRSALRDAEITQAMRYLNWSAEYMESMFMMIDYDDNGEASIQSLQRLTEASNLPLDTANYVRFQINLARRLEFQERLTLTALDALEKMSGKHLELPESVETLVKTKSFLAPPSSARSQTA